jgi:dienelactone hydrolase
MLSPMNRRSLLQLLAAGTAGLAIGERIAWADAPASSSAAGAISVSKRIDPDQLPAVKELPDPFTFADGTKLKSKVDWPKRQAELKELIQTYEYGHLPPVPPKDQVKVVEDPKYALPVRAGSNKDNKPPAELAAEKIDYPEGTKVTSYLVTVGPENDKKKQVAFHLVLTVPPGKGPLPVIIRGDLCWGPPKADISGDIAQRGYILAQFDRTEIVPDHKGERNVAAYLVYPEGDFSALAAWAWGYHRVIDYLETRPDVAKDKIVVTGHSRGGKTALVAGLMDDRVALTVPNCSGCGGAGCYRYQPSDSEDIARITKSFPYWFQPEFTKFIGKVEHLPIDQHMVKAAIAPRALMSNEALGDRWANPEGSQMTYSAAKEVYDWLGAGDKIAIHYREGKHEQNREDWNTLMEFADQLFFKKQVKTEFNKLPFPKAEKIWSWSAPK